MAGQIYHRLTIIASARHTEIWLGDDCGHFVQKEVGALRTSLLPGGYVVSFGLEAPTYPINLNKPVRTTQRRIEAGPTCPRPIPQIPPE